MTSRNAFGGPNHWYHQGSSRMSGTNRSSRTSGTNRPSRTSGTNRLSLPAYQNTKSHSVSDRENDYKEDLFIFIAVLLIAFAVCLNFKDIIYSYIF